MAEKLNWNARGLERLNQNANNLICLAFYEVAFERVMGIRGMDDPLSDLNEITEDIYRNFATYMPKSDVEDVVYTTGDDAGDYQMEVRVSHGDNGS